MKPLGPERWERRFAADAARAREAAQLYREMGFEVRLEPVGADPLSRRCDACGLGSALQLLAVYTRRRE